MKRWLMALVTLTVAAIALAGCRQEERRPGGASRLTVVTTIFPLYDFARTIAGGKADVTMLLPPGVEPHGFEPRPDDIVRINKADVFIYTNKAMEPWADDLVKGADRGRLTVVDASRGTRLLPVPVGEGGGHGHGEGAMDPHVWLDFGNAQVMVDNIAAALAAKDPANRSFYLANAAAYKAKLAALDQEYRRGLATCAKRTFLAGGHFAFGYLAHRYGLHYEAAYAVSADAEPTPAKLAELITLLRRDGLHYVYTEELIDPRTAEMIARETGAKLLKLNAAHTVSRDDLARGVTFLSLMEQNLASLREGLECR